MFPYTINFNYIGYLSKTFDLVSHPLLPEMIGALGFDGVIIGWIVIFLWKRDICLGPWKAALNQTSHEWGSSRFSSGTSITK